MTTRTPKKRPRVAARDDDLADDGLAELLKAAGCVLRLCVDYHRLESLLATLMDEKVGSRDLFEALAKDDLADLLSDCGLEAGERAKLSRELKKRADP